MQTSSPGNTIRVMIVDDHKTILWGLERLVESAGPHMQVVATACSCADLLTAARDTQPDVIVLDLDLNGEDSLAALPALKQCSGARVLILTGDRKPASHQAALLAGARGVLLKDESAEVLLQAIEHVYAGNMWIARELMDRMLGLVDAEPNPPQGEGSATVERLAAVTPREHEIIRAMVRNPGAKSEVIAEGLGISEHTLRNYLTAIYVKLGVANRTELFAFASEHGLATD